MCDYSLQNVKSRPAQVGDKLETRNFGTGTTGFCDAADRERPRRVQKCASCRRFPDVTVSRGSTPGCLVCQAQFVCFVFNAIVQMAVTSPASPVDRSTGPRLSYSSFSLPGRSLLRGI